ncbi:hypothetical protein PMAYCL1PPCAC_08317, partial [Pristionchus mayeri]
PNENKEESRDSSFEDWADRLVNMKGEEDEIAIRVVSSSPVPDTSVVEDVPSFELDMPNEMREETENREDWDGELVEEETIDTASRPIRPSSSRNQPDMINIKDVRVEFPNFPVVDEEMEKKPSLAVEKKGGLRRSGRLQEMATKREIEDANCSMELKKKGQMKTPKRERIEYEEEWEIEEKRVFRAFTHDDFYRFCDVCSLRFLAENGEELKEHEKNHKGFDCLLCETDRGSREKLAIHMALVHSDVVSPTFEETDNLACLDEGKYGNKKIVGKIHIDDGFGVDVESFNVSDVDELKFEEKLACLDEAKDGNKKRQEKIHVDEDFDVDVESFEVDVEGFDDYEPMDEPGPSWRF